MRPILLGPFGSMGSLWLKLRIICIEDMFIEGCLSLLNILRVLRANQDHEVWSAWASVIGSTLVFFTTSILVLDGGVQCCFCRSKPICTWLCCNGSSLLSWLSDKHLMRMFFITSQLGISMGIVCIVSECLTLSNETESQETAIQVSLRNHNTVSLKERDQAIMVIILQLLISIPWRLYTMKVSKGVLDAIHVSEELDFRSEYGADALRLLIPHTGINNSIDIANKNDLFDICKLQYLAFSKTFQYIGIPSKLGSQFMLSQLKRNGRIFIKKWLGRAGVARDVTGRVVSVLHLQLPGDIAAYEQCVSERESGGGKEGDASADQKQHTHKHKHKSKNNITKITKITIDNNNSNNIVNMNNNANVTSSYNNTSEHDDTNASTNSNTLSDSNSKLFTINWKKFGLYDSVGVFDPLRYLLYRFRSVIMNDHVCAPGEAYIEFISTCENSRGLGAGSRLIKWAEQSAEALGCGRITITLEGENIRTMSLFHRHGYIISRQYTDVFSRCCFYLLFGTKKGYYIMEKPLGQDQGVAVYSNLFGFQSHRLDTMTSRHDGSLHSAFGLLNSTTRDMSSHDISRNNALNILKNNGFERKINGDNSSVQSSTNTTAATIAKTNTNNNNNNNNMQSINSDTDDNCDESSTSSSSSTTCSESKIQKDSNDTNTIESVSFFGQLIGITPHRKIYLKSQIDESNHTKIKNKSDDNNHVCNKFDTKNEVVKLKIFEVMSSNGITNDSNGIVNDSNGITNDSITNNTFRKTISKDDVISSSSTTSSVLLQNKTQEDLSLISSSPTNSQQAISTLASSIESTKKLILPVSSTATATALAKVSNPLVVLDIAAE
eukprot:gene2847-5600_t